MATATRRTRVAWLRAYRKKKDCARSGANGWFAGKGGLSPLDDVMNSGRHYCARGKGMKRTSIAIGFLCLSVPAVSGCAADATLDRFPMRTMAGDWGWDGSEDCSLGPIRFRFSDDGKRMSLRHLTEVEDGKRGLPLVETGYSVIREFPDRLRLRMDDEDRTDKRERPVTWDLVLIDANAYCWHRGDWPEDACTKPVRRCVR